MSSPEYRALARIEKLIEEHLAMRDSRTPISLLHEIHGICDQTLTDVCATPPE